MVEFTINEARCKGCGLCVSVCPKRLLKLSADKGNDSGYHPVEMRDEEACLACGACFRICPDTVITIVKREGGSLWQNG